MVFMVLIDNQNIQNRSYKAATFFKKYLEHPASTHPAVLSGVNPINVTHVGQAVGINFVGKSVASSSHFFVVQPTAKLEIFVRKGVGIARILWGDKKIDVFTTHLVSYTKVLHLVH